MVESVIVHELSLLGDVVSTVSAAAAHRPIRAVGLKVGHRSGVLIDALTAAWPLAITGTHCAEAALDIEAIPATVYCPTCATEQEIDEFFALCCPVCGTPTGDLRQGKEFEIAWIDVES